MPPSIVGGRRAGWNEASRLWRADLPSAHLGSPGLRAVGSVSGVADLKNTALKDVGQVEAARWSDRDVEGVAGTRGRVDKKILEGRIGAEVGCDLYALSALAGPLRVGSAEEHLEELALKRLWELRVLVEEHPSR